MDWIIGDGLLPAHLRGGVLALGNFDGFHLGHQAVVGAARDRARAQARPALVASFDPHPARLFRPDAPPFQLTTPEQWRRLMADFGMDGAIRIPFTRALAGLSAADFVAEWLVARLGVAGVVTGGDFTFGRGREGDVARLAALGAEHGFVADVAPTVADDVGAVSSSRVRAALAAGDPRGAARLLTRPFAIRGEVIKGAQLGRSLGFPTANMVLGEQLRPRYGVYAVRVALPDGIVRDGVANLGIRPMIEPPVELLESWILDWAGDLYGQVIEVALVEYLRPEMKLDGLEALSAQVRADADAARVALANPPAWP
jgi:riboflavin kinase/FMN adenylyltransferase